MAHLALVAWMERLTTACELFRSLKMFYDWFGSENDAENIHICTHNWSLPSLSTVIEAYSLQASFPKTLYINTSNHQQRIIAKERSHNGA
jgi:hypothetical protein